MHGGGLKIAVQHGADAPDAPAAALLRDFTTEITVREKKSLDAAGALLSPGAEVFVAALPKDKTEQLIAATGQLHRAGLKPTPHIVARNIADHAELDDLLGRLARESGVEQALVLGGDRDHPKGAFTSSRQVIESGLLQKHGIRRIFIGCYPEGHPRIADSVLDFERAAKISAAQAGGLEVELVSQFCFEAAPIIAFAERLRTQGVTAPFRVGVAGPADRATLIKYALICGVGPSLRALKERQELARNVLMGETPSQLLSDIARVAAERPELGIAGVHFFTFGALDKTAAWAARFSARG